MTPQFVSFWISVWIEENGIHRQCVAAAKILIGPDSYGIERALTAGMGYF